MLTIIPNEHEIVTHTVDRIEFNEYYSPERLNKKGEPDLILSQIIAWKHVVEARQRTGSIHYLDDYVPLGWHMIQKERSKRYTLTKRGEWYYVSLDYEGMIVIYKSKHLIFTKTLYDPEAESRFLGQVKWGTINRGINKNSPQLPREEAPTSVDQVP